MIDTTTSVDVGLPPRIPSCEPAFTACTAVRAPHRDLPHTGGTPILFGASGVLLVGLVIVWFSRPVKRYVVRRGTDTLRPWIIYDRHLCVMHSDWTRKDAAKHRAQTMNAGWTK